MLETNEQFLSHQMAKLTTRASGWGHTHPESITAFMTKQKLIVQQQ